jgi:hypothetical protein
MKLISLISLSLVAANPILPSVNVTENANLVSSLEAAIQQYMEQQGSARSAPERNARLANAPLVAPVAKIGTEAEARGFIKYAGAAYCSQDQLVNWSCANCNGYAAGGSEITYFSDADTNSAGYLAINKNQKLIILGYRGTDDITNWILNIQIKFANAGLPAPNQNANVHTGFNKITNALLPASESRLVAALAKYPDYKVVLTGHSLGGAIATLTGYRLAEKGTIPYNKINIITYGQPRVGDPQFASYLNSKPWTATRVTAYADLVAISPGIGMGYGHNQYNMHINKSGQTVKCSIYQEDNNCISDHWFPSIDAHFTYWDQRMNSKC